MHRVEDPPRSARTRCSVFPPSRLYSAAVLSSALLSLRGRVSWCVASSRVRSVVQHKGIESGDLEGGNPVGRVIGGARMRRFREGRA